MIHRALVFGVLFGVVACGRNAATQAPEVAVAASEPVDVFAGSELPPTHAALPGDPMEVSVHRLANGLTVYVSTDRLQPRFSASIVVRTGSRNDPADSTGLAHYLEHMLFKGTDELGTLDHAAERVHLDAIAGLYRELRGASAPEQRLEILAAIDRANLEVAAAAIPGELDRVQAELGMRGINAYTSHDYTEFVADVPAARLEAWAALEAERFEDPIFRLFYPELEVVYQEKNNSLDDPGERELDATLRNLFPRHPYGTQTVFGETEHLKLPAYHDMAAYYERWYVPNNMAVLLAGDVDAAVALPVLERTLGRLQAAPLQPPPAASLTPIAGRVQSEFVADGQEEVVLGWQTVAAGHPDEPALAVMAGLLFDDTTGLVDVELELSQKVPAAGGWSYGMREAGLLVTYAALRAGQTHAEVEALLLEVIAKLKRGEFTQADVDAIVLHHGLAEKRRLERAGGRMDKLRDAFVERRAWADVLVRDRRLRAVTREDVIRAAKKYLGRGFSAVYRRTGTPEVARIETPAITPFAIDTTRRSRFAEQILAMPGATLAPEWLVEGTHYGRVQLPAGPLVAARNARNDLFEVTYLFERGLRREPLLCHALAVLAESGTAETSAEALKKRLYALGTRVSFACSSLGSTVTIDGVDANMDASVRLVEQWFREVRVDAERLRAIVDNALSTRRHALEDPAVLADALADYALLGADSPHLLEPSNARLLEATPARLAELLREFPDHRHRTFYFGPRTAAAAAKALALGDRHRTVRARAAWRFREVAAPTLYFTHREVAKSSIVVGIPTAPQSRERRPSARLLNEYLDGSMNGLLFQELREARGLVYDASVRLFPGERPRDAWLLRGGFETQSEKATEALQTFLELLRRPLDEHRLGSARIAVDEELRGARVDPRHSVWMVARWDDLGERRDPRPWIREQLDRLTPEALQAFAGSYAERPPVVSLVGNRDRVDLDGLRQLAAIVEVEPASLFSFGEFPAAE
ncbi:M16 family metallopeptidase [Nannocystis radixulma]|uniref:Insulinase family protein n=1 Tax=Nannocystis radixulma TaxID=2995305 RepID=A0ABT5BG63_9BACT|nr:M16 family metallopeptidase [Nannocystis radixulma]MDC0672708.1 insulinase family protein [Nannocystis radixulma]